MIGIEWERVEGAYIASYHRYSAKIVLWDNTAGVNKYRCQVMTDDKEIDSFIRDSLESAQGTCKTWIVQSVLRDLSC